MILVITLILFLCKFHEAKPYLNYLIALCLLLMVASLFLIAYVCLRLTISLEEENRKIHEGEDYAFSLVLEKPLFHGLLRPHISIKNLSQDNGKSEEIRDCRQKETLIVLKGLEAGTNRIRISRMDVYGFFALFFFPLRTYLLKKVNIYPKPDSNIRPYLQEKRVADEGDVLMQKGDNYHELSGLRPFQDGDNLRYMHKAQSARLDDVIIKEGSRTDKVYFTFVFPQKESFGEMKEALGASYALARDVIGNNSYGFSAVYRQREYLIYNWQQFYEMMDRIYADYERETD